MKILELTSDVVFKAFMMSENTKDYKARLISLITGIDEELLKNAVYRSVEFPINKDKIYKSDIVVTIDKNIINVEMNNRYYAGIVEKNITYINKIRSEGFDIGDNYLGIERVIQINIDNYSQYKGNKLVYKFQMRDIDTHELETNSIESYHIDLAYLEKNCYNKDKLSELEKLLEIFITTNDEKLNTLRSDKVMEEAINELKKISGDEKIIGLYDAAAVERKIRNTELLGAKMEGIKKGEKKKQLEIAKKMIEKEIDKELILETTGLSIEELKKMYSNK